MSENNIDKMMKTILDNAQEEVPAHIWEGVSASLDKAAAKKKAIIWWRSSVIGAAAAALIVFGLMFSDGPGMADRSDIQQNCEIAVIEPTTFIAEATVPHVATQHIETLHVATRHAETQPGETRHTETQHVETTRVEETTYRPSSISEAQTVLNESTVTEDETVPAQEQSYKKEKETMVDWEDETPAKKSIRTSLVISGLTGTSSALNKARVNLMKRPSLNMGPARTGVKETSTNTIYGIPVSVGAGLKIGFGEKWSLGIGANYSLLTRKFYGTYTKAENGVEISSTSSDIRNAQHYIGIPVNAYYDFLSSRRINLYAYAGGTIEKCISDKYHVLSTGIVHTEKPEGVQLSANAGVGLEVLVGKHLGIYADPSLRYYFDNGQPKSVRTAQPLTFGLEMGLRIRL